MSAKYILLAVVLVLLLVACGQGGNDPESFSIELGEVGSNGEAKVTITVVSSEDGTVDISLEILPALAAHVTNDSWEDLVVESGTPEVLTTFLFIEESFTGVVRITAILMDTEQVPQYATVRLNVTMEGGTPYYEGTPMPTPSAPQVIGSVEVNSLDPHYSQMRRC